MANRTIVSATRATRHPAFAPIDNVMRPSIASVQRDLAIFAASLPDMGSVRLYAPIFSPLATGARYCSFCSCCAEFIERITKAVSC